MITYPIPNSQVGDDDMKDYYNYFMGSEYYRDIVKQGLPPKTSYQEIDLEPFRKGYLLQHLQFIDQMDIYRLAELLKQNMDLITNILLNSDKSLSKPLINGKFVDAMKLVLSQLNGVIPLPIRVSICKVAYDLATLEQFSNSKILQQWRELTQQVNLRQVRSLMGIGLSEADATQICLCRFSSMNEYGNAARVNFVIYGLGYDGSLSEQMIINIYSKIFAGGFTNLFVATMFDRTDLEPQYIHDENFQDIFGTVSNAVLAILNDMTSHEIRMVLKSYAEMWYSTPRESYPRFSLNAFARDGWERVYDIKEQMIREEGMIFP